MRLNEHPASSIQHRGEKLSVLYIIWSLEIGGAERVVVNLAKGLDKSKFVPLVCCLNEKGALAQELEKEGVRVIALHKQRRIDVSVIKKLVEIIRENHIDIVHTHLWGANFCGRIAARKAKVPVIIATEHNSDIWKTRTYFMLDWWLSLITHKIIAVSESVKAFYVQHGIDPKKIEVIYNGIETGTVSLKSQGQSPQLLSDSLVRGQSLRYAKSLALRRMRRFWRSSDGWLSRRDTCICLTRSPCSTESSKLDCWWWEMGR